MVRSTAASADCYYPANSSFEALSYQDKTDYFWGRITESRNRSNYPSAVTVLTTSSQTSFYDMTDVCDAPGCHLACWRRAGLSCCMYKPGPACNPHAMLPVGHCGALHATRYVAHQLRVRHVKRSGDPHRQLCYGATCCNNVLVVAT